MFSYHNVLLELRHFFLAGVSVVRSQKLGQVTGEQGVELHEEVVDGHFKMEMQLLRGQACQCVCFMFV